MFETFWRYFFFIPPVCALFNELTSVESSHRKIRSSRWSFFWTSFYFLCIYLMFNGYRIRMYLSSTIWNSLRLVCPSCLIRVVPFRVFLFIFIWLWFPSWKSRCGPPHPEHMQPRSSFFFLKLLDRRMKCARPLYAPQSRLVWKKFLLEEEEEDESKRNKNNTLEWEITGS